MHSPTKIPHVPIAETTQKKFRTYTHQKSRNRLKTTCACIVRIFSIGEGVCRARYKAREYRLLLFFSSSSIGTRRVGKNLPTTAMRDTFYAVFSTLHVYICIGKKSQQLYLSVKGFKFGVGLPTVFVKSLLLFCVETRKGVRCDESNSVRVYLDLFRFGGTEKKRRG